LEGASATFSQNTIILFESSVNCSLSPMRYSDEYGKAGKPFFNTLDLLWCFYLFRFQDQFESVEYESSEDMSEVSTSTVEKKAFIEF
jgi:hypothetical protein